MFLLPSLSLPTSCSGDGGGESGNIHRSSRLDIRICLWGSYCFCAFLPSFLPCPLPPVDLRGRPRRQGRVLSSASLFVARAMEFLCHPEWLIAPPGQAEPGWAGLGSVVLAVPRQIIEARGEMERQSWLGIPWHVRRQRVMVTVSSSLGVAGSAAAATAAPSVAIQWSPAPGRG